MLKQIPTFNHLSRMYFELSQQGGISVGEAADWPYSPQSREELIALASDMSRFDPRLFEVIVDWVFHHWTELNPYRLRQMLKTMTFPQTLCVIFNFVTSPPRDSVPTNSECLAFYQYLCEGIKPVNSQLYFTNIYPKPAGSLMTRAVTESLKEYLDWGFLARERPIIHHQGYKIPLGYYSLHARQNIIRRLADLREGFGLSRYLDGVAHTISRQQALNDLKNCPFIKSKGKGRGSRWFLK